MLCALAGCHPIRAFKSRALSCHNKQPYMTARGVAPLKIPSDLEKPDTTNALHVPELNEPVPPKRSGRDPCLDEPPAYKVAKPTPQA